MKNTTNETIGFYYTLGWLHKLLRVISVSVLISDTLICGGISFYFVD